MEVEQSGHIRKWDSELFALEIGWHSISQFAVLSHLRLGRRR